MVAWSFALHMSTSVYNFCEFGVQSVCPSLAHPVMKKNQHRTTADAEVII